MTLKRSCSLTAAMYVLCALFVGHLVWRRFPVVGAVIGGAIVGGGIVWMGLAYLAGVWTKLAEARRLRRSLEGGVPADGETVAVLGTLEPVGAPLTSPLTGQPCVAYKYEVHQDERLLYDGFAIAPSVVDSPHGRIRILAYPTLQTAPHDVPDAAPRFDDYVAATTWHPPEISLSNALKRFNDRDGSARVDTRMVHDDPDLTTATFKEWSFAPGDRVFATGRYSLERGGLVAEPGVPMSVTLRDGAQNVTARSVAGAFGNLVGGLIFLAVAAAGIAALYAFVPLAASEQMAPSLRRTWREVRLERKIDRRLRPPLRKAGLLDSGIPSVLVDLGTAHGRVAANGRDVDVSRATADRVGDLIAIHIDDDAAVLTIDNGEHPIRLRLAGQEIDPSTFAQSLEVEITSSMHHGEVAGRFTYFQEDAETPAARVTFRAGIAK